MDSETWSDRGFLLTDLTNDFKFSIIFLKGVKNNIKWKQSIMKFIDLRTNLKNYFIFTLRDVLKLDDDFDRRRLSEWQDKGYICRLRNMHYYFSDLEVDENILLYFSNKIYEPSYVSFETALRFYNFIPESVYEITAVTSRKTQCFRTKLAVFRYHHLSSELMFGYVLKKFQGKVFKIASPEKALLDFLYIHFEIRTIEDFRGLRFNYEEMNKILDWQKLDSYLHLFKKNNLDKKIKILKEELNVEFK